MNKYVFAALSRLKKSCPPYMAFELAELEREINEPWRPIADAPRDVDEPVLVHHFEWDAPAVCNYIEAYDEWCMWGDGSIRGIPMPQPTHWMPLPTPPPNQELPE